MTLSIRLKSITRIACIYKSHHASQKYPTMRYIFNRNVPTCSHCRLVLLPAVFPSSDKMYHRSDRGPVLVHIADIKWCIWGYKTGALWDFCNRHIPARLGQDTHRQNRGARRPRASRHFAASSCGSFAPNISISSHFQKRTHVGTQQ